MKKSKIYFVLMISIMTISLIGCSNAEKERAAKDKISASEGLDRVVTVYSSSGEILRTYEGKFDIEENTYYDKILFDYDGKRHIIYVGGGTVIVDEK